MRKDSSVEHAFKERKRRLEWLESLDIPEDHMCKKCITWYREHMGIMPPICKAGKDLQVEWEIEDLGLKGEEAELYRIINNPVKWAKEVLGWEARWYQEELLLCSAIRKAVRAGRRVGKTDALTISSLWVWHTIPESKILVIAPFQDQVDLIFQNVRAYLQKSGELSALVTRDRRNPQILEQVNGNFMMGITAGSKSGMKGDKARGQDATHMYWDEADYLDEKTMDSLLGILASRPYLELWTSTTPTGARSFFYEWCTDKQRGYKEWHYHSNVSPMWNMETEFTLKQTMTATSYAHEFEAEFADSEMGVYQQDHIDACLEDYDPNECKRVWEDGYLYALGVDWNEAKNGVQLVGVEYNPNNMKLKVCLKRSLHDKEFTQLRAVELIRDLQLSWKFDTIYVDQGYGDTQIQILHRMGKANPKTRLANIVKGIKMGGKTVMYDPITQSEEKHHTKHLIVDMTARRVEVHQCILPKMEDIRGGLVWEMRNFIAESVNSEGIPKYSSEHDHSLVGWQLAVFSLLYEFSPLTRRSYSNVTSFVDVYNHHSDYSKPGKPVNTNKHIVPRTVEKSKFEKNMGFVRGGLHKKPLSPDRRTVLGEYIPKRSSF